MNKTVVRKTRVSALVCAVIALSLCSCASNPVSGILNSIFAGNSAEASSQPAAASKPAGPMYTGDGGENLSLAVLVPEGSGLAADQNYLPTLVQGVLVGDLSKYSAIKVLDRQSLEKTLAETESGIYTETADYGKLGEIAQVNHILTGNITKTSSGYAMQIQVVGAGTDSAGITKASYSGSCTVAELDDFTGIKKASLDLLTQMGVQLTGAAKSELSGAGARNYIDAQTAVAQGIIAQRSGNIAESMARFYEANSYDASFAEAASRANAASANIRTGSLGDNIRNDIAWRDEWIKILDDAKRYLQAQSPVLMRVVYDPNLMQGKTNYEERTVEFTSAINSIPVPYPEVYFKMLADLNAGLAATQKKDIWNLKKLDLHTDIAGWGSGSSVITANLVNNDGKIIAVGESQRKKNSTGRRLGGREINSAEINIDMGMLFTGTTTDYTDTVIFTVKADDITDQMSINMSSPINIQLFTKAEYQAQLEASGLPPLPKGLIEIVDEDGRKKRANLIVEIAAHIYPGVESGLAYRPSLADGEGLYIEDLTSLKEMDTTHYRFPVSVAIVTDGIIDRIINIDPGEKISLPANRDSILIVPQGWFGKNGVRRGDYIRGDHGGYRYAQWMNPTEEDSQ